MRGGPAGPAAGGGLARRAGLPVAAPPRCQALLISHRPRWLLTDPPGVRCPRPFFTLGQAPAAPAPDNHTRLGQQGQGPIEPLPQRAACLLGQNLGGPFPIADYLEDFSFHLGAFTHAAGLGAAYLPCS